MRYARIALANMLPHLPTLFLAIKTLYQSILCKLHYVLHTPYARPTYMYLLQVFHPCTTPYIPSSGAPMLHMTSTYMGPSGDVAWWHIHSVTSLCIIDINRLRWNDITDIITLNHKNPVFLIQFKIQIIFNIIDYYNLLCIIIEGPFKYIFYWWCTSSQTLCIRLWCITLWCIIIYLLLASAEANQDA
jgi:hypothetical protein